MNTYATGQSTGEAVDSLKKKIGDFPVANMIFFVSSLFDAEAVAHHIHDAFPEATTIGCTSYSELYNSTIRSGSISAMAFAPEALDTFAASVVENVSTAPNALRDAVEGLERQLGKRLLDLDFHTHFGIGLYDGRSPYIERIMDKIGNISDIVMIGGAASDDFSMEKIRVFHNGRAYQDAAVLTVVKPSRPFSLLKTQSAQPTGISSIATKVDVAAQTVFELDHRPAAEVYAEAIGVGLDDIRDGHFLEYAFGIMAEGEPFLRAVRRLLKNGGLQLFCSVLEGQRMCLTRTGDVVETTAKTLETHRAKLGSIEAVLDFDCAHRDLSLQSAITRNQYAQLFDGIKATGFSTFGELYIATVNQTAVMALFS
jgi:Uncharacterized conserved protein